MNLEYDFDDIDDYLQDRMSDTDRAAFERALETNPELVQRVEVIKAEAKVLRLLRDEYIMDQFESWDKESIEKKTPRFFSAPGTDKQPFNSKKWLLFALIVTILVILVVVYFNQVRPAGKKLPAVQPPEPSMPKDTTKSTQIIDKEPVADVKGPNSDQNAAFIAQLTKETYRGDQFNERLMGDNTQEDTTDPYVIAVQLYEAKNYKAALNLLQQPNESQKSEYLYLRGYIYYHLGQYAKAEQDFHAFRGMQISDHKIDAVWREVFCLVPQLPGSRKRLEGILQEIMSNPSNAYYKDAVQLKKGLERL